jgi:quercetin dioxygenase-like cupin family protein
MPAEKEYRIIHENISPDFERKIAYLENLMVVVCDFKNGPMKSPETPHSHPHEQITFVAEGEVEFFKGEEKLILTKNDLVLIPSGIPHCIKLLSDHAKLIDSFSPIRKEFIK